MPVYEFVCEECRRPFEELVLGSEEVRCPSCDSPRLAKQLSVFSAPSAQRAQPFAPGACGTCGDPRGPGSCATG